MHWNGLNDRYSDKYSTFYYFFLDTDILQMFIIDNFSREIYIKIVSVRLRLQLNNSILIEERKMQLEETIVI